MYNKIAGTEYRKVKRFDEKHPTAFQITERESLIKIRMQMDGYTNFRWIYNVSSRKTNTLRDDQGNEVIVNSREGRISDAKYSMILEYEHHLKTLPYK